jgi:hypothetical protein
MGQGPIIPLEFPPVAVVSLPAPEQFSGISIGFENYRWLDLGRRRPIKSNDVNWPTLTFTFYKKHSYHPSTYNLDIALPVSAEPLSFNRFRNDVKVSEYWANSLSTSLGKKQADKAKGLFNITVPIKFPNFVKGLIGEGGAGLRVNGSYRVSFDGRSQWDDRTQVATYKQSKFPSLNMEQISRFKISGTIGSKIEVKVDQDSKRQADLDNRIQIRYKGTEDDIIQTIEAGNTNLSLPNTQFVGYSQRVQGLFGIKATAQLGNFGFTVITSQEKGNTEKSSFTAGSKESVTYVRDYDYLKNTFFDLGTIYYGQPGASPDTFDFAYGDKIVDFRLYLNETDIERYSIVPGNAHVDPRNPDLYPDEEVRTTWREIDKSKFIFYENELYLEMFTNVGVTQDLACWMEVEKSDGSRFQYGDISADTLSDTLILKLIKRGNPLPSYRTFQYEWKNIYSLRARDVDPDGLEVQIFKGKQGEENREDANLDHLDGEPYIEIMGLDKLDLNGSPNPDGLFDINENTVFLDRGFIIFPTREPFRNPDLKDTVPEIYTESNYQNIRSASKYYLAIKLKQRQTEFSLGKINIIEGSEIVTLNGRRLSKDKDYTIYYDLGRIIFRTDEVLDPNANVTIDFEYQPFIAAEKKSLFGARLEYVLSRNFKIGSTLLLKTEKSTDRKPRIGQEESKYMIWDSDFSTSFELPILTSLFDALPLIEATSPSRISISGEIAQSIPNPNTRGEAYVDDFEGAKEAYSLSILRHAWTRSSSPEEADEIANPRGRLIWYNPYDEIPVTDIWDRDVQDKDNKAHILVFRFDPDTTISNPDLSWAGVMRPISRGAWDQSRTQFLEIRMKKPDGQGQLRIHLGEISEDIDNDQEFDTEDFVFKNDILDEGEDVGLDNWTDAEEKANIDSTEWFSSSDPSGDNWHYDNDDPDNYEHINGTHGNANDPGRGFLPDTEDISGDKSLNTTNAYFEFILNFQDQSKYLVEGSEKASEFGGTWVTYRFPLIDFDDSVGASTWNRISYARMIMTDLEERKFLEIASINLVSTRWLVQPLRFSMTESGDWLEDSLITPDTVGVKLEVAVINTEENGDIYEPPPNVEGYYDRVSETREKEQSLLLKYTNLKQGVAGIAERVLFRGENYAGYKRVQVYVHSDTTDTSTSLIFRMGTDSLNYYEFRTKLHGDRKWDQRNWIDIDLDAITQVKDELLQIQDTLPSRKTLRIGKYGIRGRPRLTNIIYLAVGVERDIPASSDDYNDNDFVSGEIWLDELRVTDVRRDKGLARRLSIATSVSDLGSFSISYRKTDAYFRQLTAANRNNLGAGKESASLSISTSFSLDKLLPPQWGARLPVSYSWTRNTSVPRLKSGSDIVITEKDREEETTRSYSTSFRISSKFTRKTNNWLWNLTLNNFGTNFSYSANHSKSPTQPFSENESYTARVNYSLVTKKKTFKVFTWTRFIPFFPSAITNTEMGYFPKRMTFKGDVNRKKSESINSKGTHFSTYDRQFGGSFQVQYNLFGSLPLSFNYTTKRDLRDPETLKLSFNPKTFKLGTELSRRQSFTADYNPKLVNFLTTRFKFKASYDENADPKRYKDGTRLASINSNYSLGGSFDLQKFLGQGRKGDFIAFKPFLWGLRKGASRIDPISLQYSQDNRFSSSGLVGRPSMKFQFGLTKDPGVETKQTAGSARRFSDSKAETYSAKSGIKFILGTKISTGYAKRLQTSATQRVITKSVTFPNFGVNMGRLERYRVIGWVFKSLSLNSSYNRKIDKSINKNTGAIEKENISHNFGPLFGFSVTWLKSIQTTGRLEYSKSSNKTINSGVSREQRNTSQGFTLSNRYSFRSPTGFKIPLFGRIKFQSTLNLTLDISKRLTKSENVDGAGNVSPGNERTDLTFNPRISYSFSSSINGGLQMRWSDTDDKRTRRKSHIRQVGIWVEIRF